MKVERMLGEREMADDKVVEAQEGKEEHNHDQERDVSQWERDD